MKKYTITIEKECTFEIDAENEDLACDKAKELFDRAETTYYIEDEKEI